MNRFVNDTKHIQSARLFSGQCIVAIADIEALEQRLQIATDALKAIKDGTPTRQQYIAKYDAQFADDPHMPDYMVIVYHALAAIEDTE